MRLARELNERGIITVTDETAFSAYLHIFHLKELQRFINIRVFGKWISSGIPFSSILAEKRIFEFTRKNKSYQQFQRIYPVIGLPPIFKFKAAIEHARILNQYGGIKAIVQKYDDFYSLLKREYFEIINHNIYIKEHKLPSDKYEKLFITLLEKSLYFPFFPKSPLSLSLSHSDDLLKICAEKLNLIFDLFLFLSFLL